MIYELLIKIGDNRNDTLSIVDRERWLAKHGDVVGARPKGWSWGTEELKHFLIGEVDITAEEAQQLESSIMLENGEMIRTHRYNVDVDTLMIPLTSDNRARVIHRDIPFQPFKNSGTSLLADGTAALQREITKALISDKSQRKDVTDLIKKKEAGSVLTA